MDISNLPDQKVISGKMVVSLRDFVKAVLLSACSDWEDADKVRILQNVKNQGKETKTQIILFTKGMSR